MTSSIFGLLVTISFVYGLTRTEIEIDGKLFLRDLNTGVERTTSPIRSVRVIRIFFMLPLNSQLQTHDYFRTLPTYTATGFPPCIYIDCKPCMWRFHQI